MNLKELSQKAIVKAIRDAQTVQQAIDNLYRVVLPGFDEIDTLVGYPTISSTTAELIYQLGSGKFGNAFLVGWIDRGFLIECNEDWWVDISKCEITSSKKDVPITREFNPAVRIRFADHLDNVAITPGVVPEGDQ